LLLASSLACAAEPDAASAPADAPRLSDFDLEKQCPEPIYPGAAEASKAEGTSVLELEVGADGKVTGVKIVGRSGRSPAHRALDNAAAAAFSDCHFDPLPGVPQRTAHVEYRWGLETSGIVKIRR
jgi:TonB family protein